MGQLGTGTLRGKSMEDIKLIETITWLGAFLGGLVAFIKGVEYLMGKFKKVAQEWLKKGLEPIGKKLDALDKKVDSVDLNATKNFIVARLEEAKRGDTLDDVTKMRLYEQYEHYIKLGGNSYIKESFEDLQKQNKI